MRQSNESCSTGLFAYEYVVTFGREVELFWKRRITVSSILFLVNRYLPLVVNIIYAPWPSLPSTYKVGYIELLFACASLTSSQGYAFR